jgi:hypothetical protein
MKVLAPFAVCSPIASNCTGSCWDLQSGQPKQSSTIRQNLPVAWRVRIEKSFAFKKSNSGDWHCGTQALRPVEFGHVQSGP